MKFINVKRRLVATVFLAAGCLLVTQTQASVVYSITSGTAFGDNGFNGGSGATFTDNMDGTYALANAANSGNNNAAFVASSSTVSGANGGAISATDTVTVCGTIDSFVGNPTANGFEFGLQNGTGFRSDPNLLFQIDDGGNRGGLAPFFSTSGPGANVNNSDTPGATEASLGDGFSFSAVYDAAGITYTVSDIITTNEQGAEPVGATSYTWFHTDAAYVANWTTLVGNSSAYYSHQKAGVPGTSTISKFSIDVTAVPEPSSLALVGLGVIGMCARRRRA